MNRYEARFKPCFFVHETFCIFDGIIKKGNYNSLDTKHQFE